MSILDKMEAALKPFAAVFDEFRIRGMDMDEVYLWVGDSTSGQKIKVSFGDCFRARETLREYESLKGQIAVVPVQTSEARKAALAKFDGLIRNIHRISKLAFIPLHVDFDKDTALVRAALRQPDTSEAVRILVDGLAEIREIWAGQEGGKAETAYEGFLLQEQERMYRVAVDTINHPAVIAAMKGVDHEKVI